MNKESIELVKKMVEAGDLSQETAEKYCPELEESDDERIRKELLDYCKNKAEKYPNDPKYKNISAWIAWLEKQGEYKKELLQELDDKLNNALENETPESLKKFLNEQKPTDKVEPKFGIGDVVCVRPILCNKKVFRGEPFKILDITEKDYVCDDGNSYSISLQDGWELIKIKPAKLDEEDFTYIENCISLIGMSGEGEINWLKELKYRFSQQPKQEWSEDDEQYLLVCKNALAKYQTTDKWDACIISHWLENKLKSIKPQPRWKPSDEQIYWLKWAVNRMPDTEKANEAEAVLEDLLEQLKKLREE